MADYAGWSNRSTWNANLWLSDVEEYYRQVNALAAKAKTGTVIPYQRLADLLEGYSRRIWPTGYTPDGDDLSQVNWQEVAKAWLE